MEELQDAIEDAQYVNAIATIEDGPRPVLPWDKPNEEELRAWLSEKKFDDFEWTLRVSAISLFLFSSFVKQSEDYLRINFCEEVARFKKFRGRPRTEKAKQILKEFLQPKSECEPPQHSQIDEYDLERTVPELKLQQTSEEARRQFELNMDYPTCSETHVGLKGPIVEEIFSKFAPMKEMEDLIPCGESSADLQRRDSDAKTEEEGSPLDGTNESAPGDAENSKRDSSTDHDKAAAGTLSSSMSDMRSLSKSLRDIHQPSTATVEDSTVFDAAERMVMLSLKNEYWEGFTQSPQFVKLQHFLWYQDRRVVPDDFFVMRVLGRGGFGLVTACKKGTSGKLYAMKVMNKRRIKMKKSEQLALNERQALAAVESNFVVNLKYSFHSKEDVFLILDLMTGGDLGYHLHQKGRFPKRECQYYTARIMLGLQALHDKQYVYRDLKPENCLLGEDGRVKISDLGLATRITPTLHGAAGTRGYWAPEMLRRDKKGKRMNYGHTVDWFSLGCCVAEFISGSNPFRSEAALNFGLERGKQTKEKAIDCATMEMEPDLTSELFEPEAADLCKRLLDKNERTRLGFTGCEEIMAHPWFKNVNWEAILSDRKRPPFVPPKDVNAASRQEIGTFAEDKAYQETQITDSDEKVYQNWDWTNPRAFSAEVIEFLIYERETGEPLLPITQNASCCCAIM